MRNKTSFWKRSLAALLSFVMVLGMFPVLGENLAIEAEAAPVDTNKDPISDYITLPITIRDFAADGMLFEYNEVNRATFTRSDDGTLTWGTPTTVTKTDRLYSDTNAAYTATYNPTYWSLNSTNGVWSATGDYTGIRIYPKDADIFKESDGTRTNGADWYCFIVDQYGGILKVLDRAADKTNIAEVMTAVNGEYSVWAWRDVSNLPYYNLISKVTEDNKGLYRFCFNKGDAGATVNVYLGLCYFENTPPSTYGNKGIYVFDGSGVTGWLGSVGNYTYWHRVVVNANDNSVVEVIPNGVTKTDLNTAYFTNEYKFVLAWSDSTNRDFYDLITAITPENYSEYQIATVSSTAGDIAVGAALFVERTISVNEADTKGFGLLVTNAKDRINNLPTTTTTNVPGKYFNNGTYGSEDVPTPIDITLNSDATQKGYGITARTDLVAEELDETTRKPAYTEATVTYLAEYMNEIMKEPWQNADGSYNSFFVMGTKLFDASGTYVGPDDPTAELDLAAMLRQFVGNGGLGDYATTMEKAATLTDVSQCETWFDAAYYLLHYTWRDNPMGDVGNDGYGMPVSQYDSLHLVAKTQEDGSVYYVFNSGYDNTAYDPANREIYNTQTETITAAKDDNGKDFYTRGIKMPAARFDPLGAVGTRSTGTEQWLGYGSKAGGNTYGDFVGASADQTWDDYYDTTNYHLSLEGHAEFVYHYSSNLYFTFTGDDDVYLYINGTRVLDLGGAHSIVKATINMNDVAELCELKEGQTCSFDFFYLERHGTAANFGIETNIQLAESGMVTTKQGYQNGVPTGYNGPVDPSKPVSYSFTLTNSSDATLTNLTFEDDKLGVKLTPTETKLNAESSLGNMYVYVRDENNAIVRFYSAATEPALSADVLQTQLANGLPKGYSMTIYNLRYTIPEAEWVKVDDTYTFTNIVNTTAVANSKQIHGTADWKVQKAALVTEPFHIYNWVRKDAKATAWTPQGVSLTKAELIQPALDAKAGLDVTNAVIVQCNGAGLENDTLWSTDYTNVIANLTLGDDGSMTYNSKTPGMVTIYYKIKGIGYDDHVYHFDVITYGVADNIYVLDYGLNVELNCDQYGFRVNDHLTVPQNIHPTTMTMDVLQTEHTWGEFVENGRDLPIGTSVEYQPKDIINGCDSMMVTIMLRETGADTSKELKYYGVDMRQAVSTAPANVVYYEENHPGITYVETSKFKIDSDGYLVDNDGNLILYEGEKLKIVDDYLLYADGTNVTYEDTNIKVNDDGTLVYEDGTTVTEISINLVRIPDDQRNQWVHYETADENGDSVAGSNQSPDQDSNYGSDPNYANDKVGTLEPEGEVENVIELSLDDSDLNALQASGVEALNKFFGLGGGDSNGTVNKLEVKQTAEVMYFEFVGTGFEIISRTTASDYAIINVQVLKDEDGDGEYETLMGYKPVITESKGGDLYQIPIISITGMERGNYKVTVKAAGSTDSVTRVLYIDGIRIYGPLANSDLELLYYNPDEYKAEFIEVKQLIEEGKVIYADLGETDEGYEFFTGATRVENYWNPENGSVLMPIEGDVEGNVYQYLSVGPNNELYMDGNSRVNLLAFMLKPKEGWPEAEKTLQIGAHRKADSFSEDMSAAALTYSDNYQDLLDSADQYMNEKTVDNANSYIIASGTEMYYTIDVDSLTPDANGNYLVMIASIGSELGINSMALTNIKVSGYEICLAELALQAAAEEGTLDDQPLVQQTFGLIRSVLELMNAEPEVEQVPVNENLHITATAQTATKVFTGRTVTLTIKADAEAQELVVTDGQGNVVTPFRSVRKVSGNVATFVFVIKVTGSSGQVLNYTARVYDANDLASVNAETFTVTIR